MFLSQLRNICTFDNLNKFLNYVTLQTQVQADAINNKIREENFAKYIDSNLYKILDGADINLDGATDFDLLDLSYLGYEIGYIDIVDEEFAEVTLEITIQICLEHTETDELNSYYDKEEEVKEKLNHYQELLQEFDESILNISIDTEDIYIPEEEFILLGRSTLQNQEIMEQTVD